ncbi:MAG TPA: collagen-like protein [Candidatus Norongarragalinales archaeon]|nr:collagen-like protein [Candidatus Norongarragalinales archaeon]
MSGFVSASCYSAPATNLQAFNNPGTWFETNTHNPYGNNQNCNSNVYTCPSGYHPRIHASIETEPRNDGSVNPCISSSCPNHPDKLRVRNGNTNAIVREVAGPTVASPPGSLFQNTWFADGERAIKFSFISDSSVDNYYGVKVDDIVCEADSTTCTNQCSSGQYSCQGNSQIACEWDGACWVWSQISTSCQGGQVCVAPNGCVAASPTPAPACYLNSDCGSNGYGANYCQGSDLYHDYLSYTCNNPGQQSASCSSNSNPTFIQTCQYGCSNGQCASAPTYAIFVNLQDENGAFQQNGQIILYNSSWFPLDSKPLQSGQTAFVQTAGTYYLEAYSGTGNVEYWDTRTVMVFNSYVYVTMQRTTPYVAQVVANKDCALQTKTSFLPGDCIHVDVRLHNPGSVGVPAAVNLAASKQQSSNYWDNQTHYAAMNAQSDAWFGFDSNIPLNATPGAPIYFSPIGLEQASSYYAITDIGSQASVTLAQLPSCVVGSVGWFDCNGGTCSSIGGQSVVEGTPVTMISTFSPPAGYNQCAAPSSALFSLWEDDWPWSPDDFMNNFTVGVSNASSQITIGAPFISDQPFGYGDPEYYINVTAGNSSVRSISSLELHVTENITKQNFTDVISAMNASYIVIAQPLTTGPNLTSAINNLTIAIQARYPSATVNVVQTPSSGPDFCFVPNANWGALIAVGNAADNRVFDCIRPSMRSNGLFLDFNPQNPQYGALLLNATDNNFDSVITATELFKTNTPVSPGLFSRAISTCFWAYGIPNSGSQFVGSAACTLVPCAGVAPALSQDAQTLALCGDEMKSVWGQDLQDINGWGLLATAGCGFVGIAYGIDFTRTITAVDTACVSELGLAIPATTLRSLGYAAAAQLPIASVRTFLRNIRKIPNIGENLKDVFEAVAASRSSSEQGDIMLATQKVAANSEQVSQRAVSLLNKWKSETAWSAVTRSNAIEGAGEAFKLDDQVKVYASGGTWNPNPSQNPPSVWIRDLETYTGSDVSSSHGLLLFAEMSPKQLNVFSQNGIVDLGESIRTSAQELGVTLDSSTGMVRGIKFYNQMPAGIASVFTPSTKEITLSISNPFASQLIPQAERLSMGEYEWVRAEHLVSHELSHSVFDKEWPSFYSGQNSIIATSGYEEYFVIKHNLIKKADSTKFVLGGQVLLDRNHMEGSIPSLVQEALAPLAGGQNPRRPVHLLSHVIARADDLGRPAYKQAVLAELQNQMIALSYTDGVIDEVSAQLASRQGNNLADAMKSSATIMTYNIGNTGWAGLNTIQTNLYNRIDALELLMTTPRTRQAPQLPPGVFDSIPNCQMGGNCTINQSITLAGGLRFYYENVVVLPGVVVSIYPMPGKSFELAARDSVQVLGTISARENNMPNGASGANGARGWDGSDNLPDGLKGQDGAPGGNGQNGGAIELSADLVVVSGVIDVSGANGGNGGYGGNGGNGGNEGPPFACHGHAGNGGDGGRGGMGGNGGNGGIITYYTPNLQFAGQALLAGGTHGASGNGGIGGNPGSNDALCFSASAHAGQQGGPGGIYVGIWPFGSWWNGDNGQQGSVTRNNSVKYPIPQNGIISNDAVSRNGIIAIDTKTNTPSQQAPQATIKVTATIKPQPTPSTTPVSRTGPKFIAITQS